MKPCIKCGVMKGIGEFGFRRDQKDGRDKTCRPCHNAKQTAWRRANPDKARAIERRFSAKIPSAKSAEKARVWYEKNKERASIQKRTRTHHISDAEFRAMLAAQNNLCAIGAHEFGEGRRTFVDHDHKTGRVRGILCPKHNTAIALLGDSVDGVYAALEYLNRPVAIGLEVAA